MSKANPMAATIQMTHWLKVMGDVSREVPVASAMVIENHNNNRIAGANRRRILLELRRGLPHRLGAVIGLDKVNILSGVCENKVDIYRLVLRQIERCAPGAVAVDHIGPGDGVVRVNGSAIVCSLGAAQIAVPVGGELADGGIAVVIIIA